MSIFRHTLAGQQVAEPIDWSSFSGEVLRDYRTRTISQGYPTSARFGLDGHAILRALWLSNDCQVVTYQVDEQCGGVWYTVMRANIIVADCVFNLTKCEVQASLVDDGIGARIANNRRIPIRYSAEKTKNSDDLPPVPERLVQVFDCSNPNPAVYIPQARRMLDWFDAMTHAVRYITDDNVSVVSAWYAALPDDEKWAITTGFQLRTADATQRGLYMEYTFDELFFELSKKYHLWMFVTRDANGDPVVNIEPESDTRLAAIAIAHRGVEDLEQDVFGDLLYASVAVGSDDGLPNLDAVESLPFLVLIGHSKERFHFEGVCNTDAELDLVSQWSIDTNLIERTIGGNTEADDDIFLVQYDPTTLLSTKGDDYTPSFQYNPALLNFRVLGRYNLPASISVTTADPSQLVGSMEQVLVSPSSLGNLTVGGGSGTVAQFIIPSANGLNFSNIIDDPGGNFQLNPGRYTAQVQGFYSFTFQSVFRVTNLTGQGQMLLTVFTNFRRFDSGGNLTGTFNAVNQPSSIVIGFSDPIIIPAFVTQGIVMDSGDYVEVRFGFSLTNTVDPQQSFFVEAMPDEWKLGVTAAPGGGTIESDSNLARSIRYQWRRHITTEDWAAITADPRLTVAVAPYATGLREGVALRITRTMGNGEATLETLTDRNEPL
jgi:hypothetical protein